ncbi:MAG: hypothetical protein H6817_07610 [Phycisphaerales bacterium]|nr:hypothetical protein [Phycisphaerales bacterium]
MRRKTHISAILGAAFTLFVVAVGGCSQQRQFQPTVAPEQMSDIQFVHYLETIPVATFGEGCRAMVIAADGSDPYDDHATRYAELVRRGWVRDAWGLNENDVLDIGTMCYMTSEVCHLKPSVCSTLLGSWGLGDRRYAIRQCVDARIIGHAPAYKPVTGGALVWTMGRAEDYQQESGAFAATPKAAASGGKASELLAE